MHAVAENVSWVIFCAINMIFTRDPIAIIFGMWLTMSKNYADATKYMTNRYSVLNVGLHFLHLDKPCRYALFRFAVTQSKYSSTKALIVGACWYWHSVHQHFAVLAAGPIHHQLVLCSLPPSIAITGSSLSSQFNDSVAVYYISLPSHLKIRVRNLIVTLTYYFYFLSLFLQDRNFATHKCTVKPFSVFASHLWSVM